MPVLALYGSEFDLHVNKKIVHDDEKIIHANETHLHDNDLDLHANKKIDRDEKTSRP